MPQFRDINVFIEKSSLDGSEEVQVSGTQKAKLVKLLEQLGENLQMSVPDKDRQTFPALGTTGKVQAWLSALAYACGIREISDSEQDTFRFLHGDNGDASVFGVVFWDRVNAVKVAVLFADYGIGADSGNTFPFAIYEGGQEASAIQADITDGAFITEITESGKWTRMFKVNSEGGGSEPTPIESLAAEKVNVAAPTLYDETTASTWQPDAANNLQELLNGLLYRTGLRSTSDGLNVGFRVVCAAGKIAIIANDSSSSSSDYSVFLFSGGSTIHTYLIDQHYVMEWVGGYSSDQDIINSIENDGNETGMLDMAGISNFATKSYVKPNDAVLTMFPSGYRTVIPGENLTTNLTSGTLKIKVPDLLTAQVKNGPFRDAVIDVPYGVTVQFADQVELLYKADGVDNFTATSGRKVYTIHYVPTTSSTTNITFRAFVNVANYK